jgi:DNA-binding LacI/PurR family transcriptional regulator
MPVDRPSPTYQRFLQALSARARQAEVELLITGLDSSMAYGAEGRVPTAWPVDGLIALDAGKAMNRFREDSRNDDTPIAIIGLETFANADSVAWDLVGASREAVERMIAGGARRIVHLTPSWVYEGYPREQRRRGYREAMEAAGLDTLFVPVADDTSRAAEAAFRGFTSVDAVFAFNDTYAIGAARALLAHGRRIPEDCAVWGFGDYPEGADFRVPLSTLRIPLEPIVERAWEWLMERIANPALDPRLELLPMDLVERASTRV